MKWMFALVGIAALLVLRNLSDVEQVELLNAVTKTNPVYPSPNLDQLTQDVGLTIESRFPVIQGFSRTTAPQNSFTTYLRSLPLKKAGSHVKYYDGRAKTNHNIYSAVVDLPIGKKNLHQCADAVIRLRANYLWQTEQFSAIQFHLTNGMNVDFATWAIGKRVKVDGNKTHWVNRHTPSGTRRDFHSYLEFIYTYAGTKSLSKELIRIKLNDMKIGDVFIQGGSPGHAIIVVDMIENHNTEQKAFLLAQSYMPAQEIQILQNPNHEFNPWYILAEDKDIFTPEWTFHATDLKRFQP